jgi:uncharacterized protein with HEPN domain
MLPKKTITFTKNRCRQDLDGDEILTLAIVRLLEILGEAAKNVSEEIKSQAPEIPWREIAETRDRLIHAYFEVNLDIVWDIITQDIQPLIVHIEKLLDRQK